MIESYLLPMLRTPSMNDAHFESVLRINQLATALQQADEAEIGEKLSALIEQTKSHYAHEEALMLDKKFPPYPAHKEEHDESLQAMQKAATDFADTKDVEALHYYVEHDLIPWFLRHTETMDAVTSIFLENSEAHLPYWERLVPRKK